LEVVGREEDVDADPDTRSADRLHRMNAREELPSRRVQRRGEGSRQRLRFAPVRAEEPAFGEGPAIVGRIADYSRKEEFGILTGFERYPDLAGGAMALAGVQGSDANGPEKSEERGESLIDFGTLITDLQENLSVNFAQGISRLE
jgi:hypothetical protein